MDEKGWSGSFSGLQEFLAGVVAPACQKCEISKEKLEIRNQESLSIHVFPLALVPDNDKN
jgi:hypothetical protein